MQVKDMHLPTRRAYHVIYDSSLVEALQYASSNNWTGVAPDLGVPQFSPERFPPKMREELREMSSTLSLEWGFHAPGDDLSLTATYPPVRLAIIEYMKQIIDFSRDVSDSATNLVVHAGLPPSFGKAGGEKEAFLKINHELYLRTLHENLSELIEYGEPDVHIALENHAWNHMVREAIGALLSEGLRLCLDIPKHYGPDLGIKSEDWAIFQENRNAIEVVHVHDWSKKHGSHQVVGTGSIDFKPSLQLLTGLGHPAQYVFEVRPRESAQESLSNFSQILKRTGISL